jgi:hypothetical protein
MIEHGPDGACATFSTDKRHRYTLRREIRENGGTQRCVFVMLNPSTADAFKLDNTVSRCREFSRRWGVGILDVVNLFAFRSPYPTDLYAEAKVSRSQVGRSERLAAALGADAANDDAILRTCRGAEIVVAAWGNHGSAFELSSPDTRAELVTKMLRENGVDLMTLGKTKSGDPLHPLARGKSFVPYDRELTRFAE